MPNTVDTTGNDYIEARDAARAREAERADAKNRLFERITSLCRNQPRIVARVIMDLLSDEQATKLADEVDAAS